MQPTLLEFARAFDPFLRLHANSVWIKPSAKGYAVSAHLSLWRPDDPYNSEGGFNCRPLPGIEASAISVAPPLTGVVTWRIPIWDQIVELVYDAEMSMHGNLGTMHANEESRVIDGVVCDKDAHRFWRISTHGRARSTERMDWMRQIEHDPWVQRS